MLTEKQLARYADVLLWGLKTARTRRFKKNDVIMIRYHMPARRLAEVLFAKIMALGMHPVQRVLPTPSMEHDYFKLATNQQLDFKTPGDKQLFQKINGSIFLHAPESITHLSDIDSKKIGRNAIANKYLRDILNKREEQGDFGWTLCTVPTDELARHADISLKDYSRQVVNACFLNRTDPVAHWKEIYTAALSIKKRLNRLHVNYFHIESKHTDLQVTPGAHRKWIGISGHNIPSFELFISPDWRGTRGTYFADQPSYRSGNYVEGVKLAFENGRAIRIQADQGEDFVKKQLAMDRGANQLGEFSLTDKRFSRVNLFMANTLYDENYGGRQGNCHIALGSSYSDTYDGDPKTLTKPRKNKLGFNDSALHWDLVNTEKKRVTAYLTNGKKKIIYENGTFVI